MLSLWQYTHYEFVSLSRSCCRLDCQSCVGDSRSAFRRAAVPRDTSPQAPTEIQEAVCAPDVEEITTMKKTIDKSRKWIDIPPMSKQQFIAEYATAGQKYFGNECLFSKALAARIIEGTIKGEHGPSPLLKSLAKLHGAKPGRVGNFLRGLQ